MLEVIMRIKSKGVIKLIKSITLVSAVFDYDNKHDMECLGILDENNDGIIGTIYFDKELGIEEFLKNYAIVKIEGKDKGGKNGKYFIKRSIRNL